MATKLGIYNEALRLLGSDSLVALSSDLESELVLDGAFSDVVLDTAEEVPWNFAKKHVPLMPLVGVTPASGMVYVFDKPSDWLATIEVLPGLKVQSIAGTVGSIL